MKKLNLAIFSILIAFIGLKSVNATVAFKQNCESSNNYYTCELVLEVMGNSSNVNEISVNYLLKNIEFSSFEGASEFRIKTSDSNGFVATTKKGSLTVGIHKIGVLKLNNWTVDCKISLTPSFKSVDRNCQLKDGIYYDKEGNETTELEQLKSCNTYVCKPLVYGSDTYYFGKDGTEITKEEFDNTCIDKIYCDKDENGKYYDNEGNETTELNYKRICQKRYCDTLNDGNNTYYYNSKGAEVSKEDFESDCRKCKTDGEKYYGENGSEVDKLTYEKTCETNICKTLSDGTKYNTSGSITDDLNFQKECEINICKVLSDGTYYGNDGKVVDETTYNLTCKVHKCEIVGDKYFDDKGNIVSKETYQKSCSNTQTGSDNPQTGSNAPFIYIFLGIVVSSILLFASKKYSRIKNI